MSTRRPDGPLHEASLKRITLRGSIVGTRKDLAKAVAFAADSKVQAHIHRAKLEASTVCSPT